MFRERRERLEAFKKKYPSTFKQARKMAWHLLILIISWVIVIATFLFVGNMQVKVGAFFGAYILWMFSYNWKLKFEWLREFYEIEKLTNDILITKYKE